MDLLLILIVLVLLFGVLRPTAITGNTRNILIVIVVVLLVWYLFGHTLPHWRGRC